MKRSRAADALPQEIEVILAAWGNDIVIARKRRRLTQQDLADKAFVARETIRRIESGDPGVSLGNLLSVMWSLGLHRKLAEAISPSSDAAGQIEEIARLPRRVRSSDPDGTDFSF